MRRLTLAFALAACTSEPSGSPITPGDAARTGGDAAESCPRLAQAADRARTIVIGHPYNDGAVGDNRSSAFARWELSEAGDISGPTAVFDLGTTFDHDVVFTPDGEIGLVAEDDGAVGVVRLTDPPTVVHAAYTGTTYTAEIVMDPAGDHAYLLNPN